MKKILIVNFSDSRGGAGIAARNQVGLIKKIKNINSSFVVAEKLKNDDFSIGPSKVQFFFHLLLRIISLLISKLEKNETKIKYSLNLFSSFFVKKQLTVLSYDVYHFHWINNDTVSIRLLSQILSKKKEKLHIFTLHDDWFFCGSEHCCISKSKRYLTGYLGKISFFDMSYFTFQRKLKLKSAIDKSNVHFTVPSNHLLEKAKSSFLLKNVNIHLIPNVINIRDFQYQKITKSELLDVDNKKFMILYGAVGGMSYLKGYDLLEKILKILSYKVSVEDICLVEFGGNSSSIETKFGFDLIRLGHIKDRDYLAKLYSVANITIVPSRMEAFGQVAAESLACETPVIAFNNSGITDIVKNNISGLLVDAYDIAAFTDSIMHLISLSEKELHEMGRKGREHIINHFSPDVITKQWVDLYTRDVK